MSKLQITLLLSITLNVVLLFIILAPSDNVEVDDSLNNHLERELADLRGSILLDSAIIEGLKLELLEAEKRDTIIKEKTVIRYETIYQIQDSARDDSVLAVLRRRADAREKAARRDSTNGR